MIMLHAPTLSRPVNLLLVEDNPADVYLMREVLENLYVQAQLYVVADGEVALAFLRREGHYAAPVRPDLILLDLHLPKKPGLEVLAEISADPSLRRIPLIVLSSSQAERDIVQSYELGANCSITKPTGLEQLQQAVRLIEGFWLTRASLPSAV
jgi:two-component system, chemotaxis family, response regulator Rcp1